jgi:hypothetical protein
MEVRGQLQALAGFILGKTFKFHRIGGTVASRTCGSFAKVIGLLTGPGIKLSAVSQLSIMYSSSVFLNCALLVFWNCLYQHRHVREVLPDIQKTPEVTKYFCVRKCSLMSLLHIFLYLVECRFYSLLI